MIRLALYIVSDMTLTRKLRTDKERRDAYQLAKEIDLYMDKMERTK